MSVTRPLEALRFVALALSPSRDPAVTQRLRQILSGGPMQPEVLARVASEHLVTPALHGHLERRGLLGFLDPDLVDYLAACADLNRERNLEVRRTLLEVASTLNRAGIEPVALKGAALLLDDVYPDPADRMLRDIDLLVPPETLLRAVEALLAEGYAPTTGLKRFDHHHHLAPLARADGRLPVELHREVLSFSLQRLLPSAGVRQRARPLEVDGVRLLVPSPEDLLIHNIVHHNHAQRFLWSSWLMLRDASDLACLVTRYGDLLDGDLTGRLCRRIGRASVEFYVIRALELFWIDHGLRRDLERRSVLRRTRLRWRLHERHTNEQLLKLQQGAWLLATRLLRIGRLRSGPQRDHMARRLLRR